MALNKDEIKQEIWGIWEILILARECFAYSNYFYNPDTKEESEYLSFSQDFDFIRHVLWRMTIIELSKLFSSSSKRDRFNLSHFISKLKKSGQFSKAGIKDLTIDNWETELSNNKRTISDILTLRDKMYAHSDFKKDDYNTVQITFQEVEKLINIIENLIKEIHLTVLGADTEMATIIFDKQNFNIIKILADEKRKAIETILGPRFTITNP